MKEKFDYEKLFMGVGNLTNRKSGKIKIDQFEYRMYNFLKQLGKVQGKICDIGCGGGEFLEKVKILFPDVEIYGCDISKKAIELGVLLASDGINLKLINEDGKLPYEDNFFNLCASFNVLEHVNDIEKNVKEIYRILKPGGVFHVCIPCEGEFLSMNWFYFKTGFGKNFTFKNWGHIQPHLTHQKMIKILESAGFEIKKINYSLHLPIDFWNLFLYFLPKELMSLFLGEKAFQYTDAAIAANQFEKKKESGHLFWLRRIWLVIFKFYEVMRSLDAIVLKDVPFTASTMHITCVKKD